MKMQMSHVVAAVSLFAALGSAPASAVSVSYSLDQSNIGSLPDGTNYLQVTITSTIAGAASFSVAPVYGFTQLSNFGIQAFGFNYSGPNTLASGDFTLPSGWSVDLPPPSAMDGFGKFEYTIQDGGSNRQSPLTFSVTNLGGATASQTLSYFAELSTGGAGQGNQYFAAHLADFQSGSDTSGYFGGVTPVPEADTYAMLLAGLGLVGFAVRRKLN